MTQIDLEIGHPAARERLSAKAIERMLAGALAVVEVVWLALLGYGAWRLFTG